MIKEQKDFKDLFDTDSYYVLTKDLDMDLLNKGFTYGFDTTMNMRTLKGYCVIYYMNCEIVIGRSMDYDDVDLYVRVLRDANTSTRRYTVSNILNKTVNDVEREILNIVKGEYR